MSELPLQELLVATKTLEDHKAEGIEVLEVGDLTPFASYYVIATSPNPRALKAHSDQLEEAFVKEGIEILAKEGEPDSGWLIIQGGDVMVHLFLAANRKLINLEELLASSRTPKA